jgi:hypothetical protein
MTRIRVGYTPWQLTSFFMKITRNVSAHGQQRQTHVYTQEEGRIINNKTSQTLTLALRRDVVHASSSTFPSVPHVTIQQGCILTTTTTSKHYQESLIDGRKIKAYKKIHHTFHNSISLLSAKCTTTKMIRKINISPISWHLIHYA